MNSKLYFLMNQQLTVKHVINKGYEYFCRIIIAGTIVKKKERLNSELSGTYLFIGRV
jgi:hypothetical protein